MPGDGAVQIFDGQGYVIDVVNPEHFKACRHECLLHPMWNISKSTQARMPVPRYRSAMAKSWFRLARNSVPFAATGVTYTELPMFTSLISFFSLAASSIRTSPSSSER